MADTDLAETNIDAQTASVMDLLGVPDDDEGQSEFAADTPSAAGDEPEGDPAPATPASDDEPTTETADPGAVEAAEGSPIELPQSFPAELREHLKSLPPDAQRAIAQFEAERTKGVNQKLEETATLRKQLEPERQRLAQQLDAAISLTQNFDPVLAAGLQRSQADWAKLANEDPAGYVREKAVFEAKLDGLQKAVAQRNEMQQQEHQNVVQREFKALTEAIPELADPAKAKAFSSDFQATMSSYGFQPNEIQGVVDHRMIKVARDAMLYRAGEAARKAAAAKVTKPDVPRVIRPGTGNANPRTAQSSALLKRAASATNVHDQADALVALIERG